MIGLGYSCKFSVWQPLLYSVYTLYSLHSTLLSYCDPSQRSHWLQTPDRPHLFSSRSQSGPARPLIFFPPTEEARPEDEEQSLVLGNKTSNKIHLNIYIYKIKFKLTFRFIVYKIKFAESLVNSQGIVTKVEIVLFISEKTYFLP